MVSHQSFSENLSLESGLWSPQAINPSLDNKSEECHACILTVLDPLGAAGAFHLLDTYPCLCLLGELSMNLSLE